MSCAVMLLKKPLGAGARMTGSDWAGLLSGYELGTAAAAAAAFLDDADDRVVPAVVLGWWEWW